jgi:hypothetical protein
MTTTLFGANPEETLVTGSRPQVAISSLNSKQSKRFGSGEERKDREGSPNNVEAVDSSRYYIRPRLAHTAHRSLLQNAGSIVGEENSIWLHHQGQAVRDPLK